jgi:hypothetical protein
MFSALFDWLGGVIVGMVGVALGWFLAMWNAVMSWIAGWIQEGSFFFANFLPPYVTTFVSNFLLPSWIREAFDVVSYCVPIKQMASIMVVTFGACAIIRLIRWIKSFVPTISGA